jgi:ADP-ribosylation factor-like protein 6
MITPLTRNPKKMGAKKSKPFKIATLGLDNSGKSTIINLLKGRPRPGTDVAPTVGCNLEEFTTKKVKFQAFDLSG